MNTESILALEGTNGVDDAGQLSSADSSHLVNEGDANLEHDINDLDVIEAGTNSLLADNSISASDANELISRVTKVRKSFRDMTPEQRKKMINKRVVTGGKMFESTLKGNSALVIDHKLEHGVLKNRFSQFVPFLDRAFVNMGMFGDQVFGVKENKKRNAALVDGVNNFYEATRAAREVAEQQIAEAKEQFDKDGEPYYELQVPVPALEIKIHIHSKQSLAHLNAYKEFDRLYSAITWLEFHNVVSKKEIDETMKSINKLALDVGRRGHMTFVELLQKRNSTQESTSAPEKNDQPLAA